MKTNLKKYHLRLYILLALLNIVLTLHAQTSGYCLSSTTNPWAARITNVQFGTLNNTSTCVSTTPPNNSFISGYCDYTNISTGTYYIGKSYTLTIGSAACYAMYSAVWTNYAVFAAYIDYNQDGDFTDPNENVLNSGYIYYNITNNLFSYGSLVNIPNNAKRGNTRLRVVISANNSNTALECGPNGYGETEDYTININNIDYNSFNTCTAIQQIGNAMPNDSNKKILQIPIALASINNATPTSFIFNTAGTTNNSDIYIAKLYKTGNSKIFNTNNLVSSIFYPASSILNFYVTNDTLLNNDTTYYWLAYDVSPSASLGNVLDAGLDSIQISGIYYKPIVNNPIGNIQIGTSSNVISATTTQNTQSKVYTNSGNNRILELKIETPITGSPSILNSINISTNGTTSLTDIANLRIWYTGNSNIFSTSNQYGNNVSNPSSLNTITENLVLLNGTNYFWVSYDVLPSAIGSNVIDATCPSFDIDGNTQFPSIVAPVGNRKIANEYYCSSSIDDRSFATIPKINIGPLLYNPGISAWSTVLNYGGSPGYYNTYYADYTTLTTYSFYKNNTFPINLTIFCDTNTIHNFGLASIYIDFNQDGDFNDSNEMAFQSTNHNILTTNINSTFGNLNIPSFAEKGLTRMRVMYSPFNSTPSCGVMYAGYIGECTINIKDDTLEYLGSIAIQSKGVAMLGTNNNKVLRVPITMGGSGVAMANKLYFNTKGSTHTSNISVAKLYRTENRANFDTSHLVASIINPNGAMVFNINDTLLNNDTTNYWLSYDVKPNAILLDTLDATFDSLEVLGTIQKPTESNPSGNIIINTMMKFLNATATQNVVKRVYPNTAKLNVLGIVVNTSSVGIPIAIDSLTISTNGTTNLSDISNLRIWYTGNNNVFDTTYQYGATVSVPSLTQNIKSNLLLANGANYFWVTYDVKATAVISNLIDAECTSISIDGSTKIPTITAPAGNIRIRTDYCYSSAQIANGQEIINIKFGGVNNSSSCVSITPGVGSVDRLYSNFTALPAATFYKGLSYNLAVTINSCNTFFGDEIVAAYIDYNQDGLFTGVVENVYTSAYATGSANQVRGGDIIIPNNVDTGLTRLRIVYSQYTSAPPCGAYSNGETEDYTINLQDCPTYFWTGATSTDFAVPTNWQPNRNTILAVDKLVFSNGGNISVTNVQNQSISTLLIDSNSQVSMSASAISVLSISDTLFLTNGSIIGSSNLTLSIGTDTIKTGTLIGNGAFKDGTMRRWVNKNMGDIIFPMYSGTNNRSIKINYSTQPNVSGYLKAQFVTTKPINNGLPLNESGILVKRAGINGYWALTATTLSGGFFSTTLNADGFNGISDPTKLVLLRRATNASVWQLHGIHVTSWGSNSSPIVSRTGMSSYGNFGMGGDTLVNSLPVSMLYLSIKKVNENALITWATSSEQNNAGFEIEKNTDINNYDWQSIGFVKGNGTTNAIHNYQFEDILANDQRIETGSLYYRLKQTDFDGKYQYSKIISLNLSSDDEDIKVYPNPFNDELNISLAASQSIDSKVELFNCLGDAIPISIVADKYTPNTFTLNNLSHLPNGVYFLKINNKMIRVVR